jgi:hypothetical protein
MGKSISSEAEIWFIRMRIRWFTNRNIQKVIFSQKHKYKGLTNTFTTFRSPKKWRKIKVKTKIKIRRSQKRKAYYLQSLNTVSIQKEKIKSNWSWNYWIEIDGCKNKKHDFIWNHFSN